MTDTTLAQPETKSLGRTAAGMTRLELRTARARNICRPEWAMITPDTALADALARLRRQPGEALLIGSDGRLMGILTERDVLLRVLGHGVDSSRPVGEFMTTQPATIHAEATLYEAMQAMEAGGFRNLPLVEDDRVVGVLHQHELLEYIAEAFPQEILNLPPRPDQLMEEPEGA